LVTTSPLGKKYKHSEHIVVFDDWISGRYLLMSTNHEKILSLGICLLFVAAGSGSFSNAFVAQDPAEMPSLISYSALPSADPDDGKFFGIAGSGLSTLAGIRVVAHIGVPAGSTYFHIGVFDGDQGGLWDRDGSDVTIYRLYKDPLKNGTTDHFVTSWLNLDCVDDDWYNRNFTTDSGAQAPSGNYFYRLEVDWRDGIPALMINNFKIRTTGQISLAAGQWFGFDGGPQRIEGFRPGKDPWDSPPTLFMWDRSPIPPPARSSSPSIRLPPSSSRNWGSTRATNTPGRPTRRVPPWNEISRRSRADGSALPSLPGWPP